jgi:prolyl 4-hydroxylase
MSAPSLEVLRAYFNAPFHDCRRENDVTDDLAGDILLSYLTVDLKYENLHQVYHDPPIYEIKEFLDKAACDRLIRCALNGRGHQQTSLTFGSLNVERTSTSWHMSNKDVKEILDKVEKLTGDAIFDYDVNDFSTNALFKTGVHSNRYESTQIVRYNEGQQYTFHLDCLPTEEATTSLQGNRVATFLLYLNTPLSGGCTSFRDLNLDIAPEQGKALLFFPCFADGTPDVRTVHAGTMAEDPKFIAQIWIRERDWAGL